MAGITSVSPELILLPADAAGRAISTGSGSLPRTVKES